MRQTVGRAAVGAALSLIVSGSLRAQDPVRLPEVKVSAKIEMPGPRRLAGIVVDTAGNPIAGAQVIVPGMAQQIFTAADGTFRLDSIRTGEHFVRVRKIGYAAQIRQVTVDSTGGVIAFGLFPVVTALPAMVSSANRRGLSGYVADIDQRSVEGATVRVLGAGLHTRTESDGSFFLPAEPGRYMVSIQKDSFATKLVSVTIPKDSGRHVSTWLQPFHGKIPRDQFWNIEDLRERAAWIRQQDRVFYSREDLARMKIEWLFDAVAPAVSLLNATGPETRDCPALVNGGAGRIPIGMLTIDDVESVEIYKKIPLFSPTTEATKSKSKYSQVESPLFLPMDGRKAMMALQKMAAMKANGGGNPNANPKDPPGCLGVIVWLR